MLHEKAGKHGTQSRGQFLMAQRLIQQTLLKHSHLSCHMRSEPINNLLIFKQISESWDPVDAVSPIVLRVYDQLMPFTIDLFNT